MLFGTFSGHGLLHQAIGLVYEDLLLVGSFLVLFVILGASIAGLGLGVLGIGAVAGLSLALSGLTTLFLFVITHQIEDLRLGELAHSEGLLRDERLAGPAGGLVLAPDSGQRVRVGAEQTGAVRERTVHVQLRDLQLGHGRGEVLLVRLSTGSHDGELHLARGVQVLGVLAACQLQGLVRTAEAALGVGHERQVHIRAGDAAEGAELAESLSVVPGGVGGDGDGLTDGRQAAGTTAGGERVLVGQLGVLLQVATRHHEVLRHEHAVPALKSAQLAERGAVQLATGDVLVDLRRALTVRAVGGTQIGRVDRTAEGVTGPVACVVAARVRAALVVAPVTAAVLPATLPATVITTAVVTVPAVALTLRTVTVGLAVTEGTTLTITLRTVTIGTALTAVLPPAFPVTLRAVAVGLAVAVRTTLTITLRAVAAAIIAVPAVALTLGTIAVGAALTITLRPITKRLPITVGAALTEGASVAAAVIAVPAVALTLGAVTKRAALTITLRTITKRAAFTITLRTITERLTVTVRTTLTITLRTVTERLPIPVRAALTITLRTIIVGAALTEGAPVTAAIITVPAVALTLRAVTIRTALTITLRTVTKRLPLAVTLGTVTERLTITVTTAALAVPGTAVAERLAVPLGTEIPAASPAAVVLCHGGFLLVRADQRCTQSISSPLWFFPGTQPGTIPSILGDRSAVSRATSPLPDA